MRCAHTLLAGRRARQRPPGRCHSATTARLHAAVEDRALMETRQRAGEERELSRLNGLKEIEHCTRRRRLCTAPKNTAGLLGGLPDSVCLKRNPGIRISKSKEPVVRHVEDKTHTEDSNTLARRKGRLGAATCVPQIICYRVSHLLPSQLI